MTIFTILVAARWLHFTALFILFGAPLFWLTVGNAGWRMKAPDLPQSFRATVLLLSIAAPLAAVTGALWLGGILANMAGAFADVLDPATLRQFFFETPFGPVALVRLVLLVAIVIVIVLPWHNRAWLAATLALSALLLVNQAWLGHAMSDDASRFGAAPILTYVVHVLTAAAWVGSFPALLFVLIEQRSTALRQNLLQLLLRYSSLAMSIVALVLISGIANTIFRTEGDLGKLLGTSYGSVLALKIFVVAVMLALASINRYITLPRLLDVGGDRLRLRNLNRRVATELALGILVVGIAAILGLTPPP